MNFQTLFDVVQQTNKNRELLNQNQQSKLLVQLKQRVEADYNRRITNSLGKEMNDIYITL